MKLFNEIMCFSLDGNRNCLDFASILQDFAYVELKQNCSQFGVFGCPFSSCSSVAIQVKLNEKSLTLLLECNESSQPSLASEKRVTYRQTTVVIQI